MKLVSLQGDVYVATRDALGNALAFRPLGDVPSIEIALATETVDHFESQSGNRLQDGRLQLGKTAGITLQFGHWTRKNLALGLYGSDAVIAPGSVSAEQLPADLVVGDVFKLRQQQISSLVLTDSAGTPANLVEGVDYEIVSAAHGTGRILNLGAYIQPFLADYEYQGGTKIALFDSAPPELFLKVDGKNTAEAFAPILAELYRVVFDPIGSMQLIHNEGYGQLEMTGSVLYDASKAADAELGQFGRVVEIAAAAGA